MTLQSSGPISLNEVHIELGASSGTLLSMNDTDVRTLAGYPTAGSSYGMNAFYGKSASSTATITVGRAYNSQVYHPRYGFATSGQTNYYHFETVSTSTGSFGSSNATTGLIASGTITNIQAVEYQSDVHIEIGTNRTSNGGFTNVKFYRQGATGTTYTLARSTANFGYNSTYPIPSPAQYKWFWSSGSTLYGSGSHTHAYSNSTIQNIHDMFEYAYNNSLKIYAEFS